MTDQPPSIIDPAQFAVEGARELKQHPRLVELSSISETALRICIKARPGERRKFQIAMFVAAGISILVGLSLYKFDWAADVSGPIVRHGLIFFLFAGLFLGLGALLWIVGKVSPERDVILELQPGLLKMESYSWQHRLVRDYSADRVRRIVYADSAVMLYTPIGNINLTYAWPEDVSVALLGVLAYGLWQDRTVLMQNLQVGNQMIPLAATSIDQTTP